MKVYSKLGKTIVSLAALFSFPTSAFEDVSNDVDLSFRYRLETVDQDGFTEDATASTIRTRVTVKTKWSELFDTVIEADDVTEVGLDDYNAGGGNTPDKAQYPVVADPSGTEINQAFVRANFDGYKVSYGRQRILIGSQRFVGGVGWRQNEQTYDSLTVNGSFGDFKLSASHVFNVNRIFGEQVAAGDHGHNTNLINLDYTGFGSGTLTGYYFNIDNEDAAGLSNDTLGVRYSNKINSISYVAEIATQSDGGDNLNNYDASYYLLDINYSQNNYSFGGGYELLGGDSAGGQGFTTSLATLHKFQGWADVFLATPTAGIADLYLKGSIKLNGFAIKAIYHDFNTDEGSNSLGTEIDIAVSKKLTGKLTGLLKFASFSSDNASYASRDKIWLMFTYTP